LEAEGRERSSSEIPEGKEKNIQGAVTPLVVAVVERTCSKKILPN
jgi:hypothetical protein